MPRFDRIPRRATGTMVSLSFRPPRPEVCLRFVPTHLILRGLLTVLLVTSAAGCDLFESSTEPNRPTPICSGWPDWETSEYVLPYPVFTTYRITAGNCTGGHLGGNRYGFDFNMPTGREVTAARSGTVVFIETGWPNDTVGGVMVNYIVIDHGDGTWGSYFHLSPGSEQVSLGQFVNQGQVIASGGASGTRNPHLHFHIKPCELNSDCDSIPVTFRNTDPNPEGLQIGRSYTALPYD